MPIRVVVCGAAGRMGRTLARLLAADQAFELAGGIGRTRLDGAAARELGYPRVETVAAAGDLLNGAHVIIDFSAPRALHALLEERHADLAGVALVTGTTGFGPELDAALRRTAQQSAVLAAANFSIAVNLVLELATTAARVLGADRYDVEIVEAHHGRKADAPSGTALALARAVAQARDVALDSVRRDGRSGETGRRPAGEIGIHALRGGEVVGEHRLHFLGARDRLEIAHVAQDRALFAEGALVAAKWLHGRAPGLYSMRQALGLGGNGDGVTGGSGNR